MSKKQPQAAQTPAEETQTEAQPEQAPADTVRLQHNSICSVSQDGTEYLADENGVFTVPAAVAPALIEQFGLAHAE